MLTLSPAILIALFAVSLVIGTAATRLSIWMSHRLGILDQPGGRKSHRAPVAYLGGLGMLLGVGAGVVLLIWMSPEVTLLHSWEVSLILAGALGIFLVGFFDDVHPLPAFLKLFLQILIASGMWVGGLGVQRLSFGTETIQAVLPIVGFAVTVGWYVALMNSINLVDGLDGLAGGITFISAGSLVAIGLVVETTPEMVIGTYLSAATAGAVLGFLVYNWHPAKTFMGDGGSLLLGFLLASASLIGSTKTPTLLALAVPIVALGLPLFETGFSFLRRAVKGQHPFKPDRRHLHHRLLDVGLSQRRVVIILLFITAMLGFNAVLIAMADSQILLINVLLLIGAVMLLIENLKFLEKRRSSEGVSTPERE